MGAHKEGSAEYAEVIMEIFVEIVRKKAIECDGSAFGRSDITRSLMECINFVYLHELCNVRDISQGLEISLSAASQLVDRLVKTNIAFRREHPEDRRIIQVGLTDDGQELIRKVRRSRNAWFESVINEMPEDMKKALIYGIEAFLIVALCDDKNIKNACSKCGIQHMPQCVINQVKSSRSSAN